MSFDVQPYLKSICATYAQWWQFYTLTDAAGKVQQAQQTAPTFDFGLMVQTIVPKKDNLVGANGDRPDREEKIERFSVLEGLRKYADRQVLLVGRPGSGKSTALARLMLEEAALTPSPSPKLGRGEPEKRRIPVLVELRYWQGSIAQLILNALGRHGLALTAEQLEPVLAQALLLFDGVNELPSEEARTQLSAFRRDHPRVPMIFTTRDLSLGGDLGIEQKLEMQPLTEAQMQAFVQAYVPEQAEALLRQLKDRLRELGQTPLLLWMLCEVIQQTPDDQLPSNLAGVFQIFTTGYEQSSVRQHEVALLKGDVRPLSDRRLWKQALKSLALTMIQGKTPVDPLVVISRNEALSEFSRIFPNEQFPVRDILDDLLKYHLLQNKSIDQIEFKHQLIQEYYAAEALLERLPGLSDAELQREYLNYLKWTEPVALMLALEEEEAQALRVVLLALDVDWMLGAQFAGAVKPKFQESLVNAGPKIDMPLIIKARILNKARLLCPVEDVMYLLCSKDWRCHIEAIEALTRIADEKAISVLLEILEDQKSNVRQATVTALGEIGGTKAVSKLTMIIQNNDHDYSLRASCADALAKMDYDSVCEACEILSGSENLDIRELSFEVLIKASIRKNGASSSIPKLINGLHSEHDSICIFSAGKLGEIKSASAIPDLRIALNNKNEYVRCAVIEALGEIGGSNAVIPELYMALEDDSAQVIETSLEALDKILLGIKRKLKGFEADLLRILIYRGSENQLRLKGIEFFRNHLKVDNESQLVEFLSSIDPIDENLRFFCACVLGYLKQEYALPIILEGLDCYRLDPRNAIHAVWALAALRNQAAIPTLLEILNDLLKLLDDSLKRDGDFVLFYFEIIKTLGLLGNSIGLDQLFHIARDGKPQNLSLHFDFEFRRIAIETLGNSSYPRISSFLIQQIKQQREIIGVAVEKKTSRIQHDEWYINEMLPVVLYIEAAVELTAKHIEFGDVASILIDVLREDTDINIWNKIVFLLREKASPVSLDSLWNIQAQDDFHNSRGTLFCVIESIQARCQFYNYDLYQAYLAAQKSNRPASQTSDRPPTIYNIEQVGILNTGTVSIHGDQIGEQTP